jgi:hypothetical protein
MTTMKFLDCPAYLDPDGATRCGLPAEFTYRFTMQSTDGPVDSAMIRCPAGHWFNGPVESLTLPGTGRRDRDTAAAAVSGRRDNPAGGRNWIDRRGGFAVPAFPAEPDRDVPRPNGAPAYCLAGRAQLRRTPPSSRGDAVNRLVAVPGSVRPS